MLQSWEGVAEEWCPIGSQAVRSLSAHYSSLPHEHRRDLMGTSPTNPPAGEKGQSLFAQSALAGEKGLSLFAQLGPDEGGEAARGRLTLGIESSCDETACAVVRGEWEVLSNLVHSQVALHAPFGGVVPEVAGRSHMEKILPLMEQALAEAGIEASDLDAVAVTHRPGLIGCLLVGLSVAKSLSLALRIPLIGVDHLQAHVHAAFMTEPDLPLPLLALVASGGHTALYEVREPGRAHKLGSTRDDAAGEALDKASAMLGLGYPGGPALEIAARDGQTDRPRFKRSLLGKDSLDFSFSGQKTALLYHLRGPGLQRPFPELDRSEVADLAASFQEAVMETLVKKMARAARAIDAQSISIGGGVARNLRLRELLDQEPALARLPRIFPPLDLCSDNGAMIASLGAHLIAQGQSDDLGLEAFARSLAP